MPADRSPDSTDTPGSPGTATPPVDLALLEAVLADTSGPAAHAAHRLADHADLVGPLVLRASALEEFRAALPDGVRDLQVHLVADASDERDGLTNLREARNGLFDEDRVEVVGVQLALPREADPAAAAAVLLDILDFSAPAWIQVPLVEGWPAALDVVAEDGTENVAVDVASPAADLAAFVRHAVDLGVAFRVTGAPGALAGSVRDPGAGHEVPGLLNLLLAVRAATDGADAGAVEALLTATGSAALAADLRTTTPAQAAAVRSALVSVDTADVGEVVLDLQALGLV